MSDFMAVIKRAGREIARKVRKVQRDFQCALQEDIWQRVKVVGAKIEKLL